jgi:thermostable 8-oxoguanine DNA glycosylase
MKAMDYKNNLTEYLDKYSYPSDPNLKEKIANLEDIFFTQPLINEIVLWKVNRYVSLNNEILIRLNNLKSLTQGRHQDAQSILEDLLTVKGVDLPMASTFLRFRNPKVFQIIDKHAYRAVYDKKYPFNGKSQRSIDKKVDVYFDYLDKLIELCRERNLEFTSVDKLLYEFDIQINGQLPK